MKIGIDIMGGDFAPQKSIHGTILALKELPKNTEIFLFGKEDAIQSELNNYSVDQKQLNIINCEDKIGMGITQPNHLNQNLTLQLQKGLNFYQKIK